MTESDRSWIREQANKVRAAHHVEPIRFQAAEAPFCEAAAEWDHDWRVVGGNPDDGTEVVECTECKVRA